jgi:thiamine-phosphate pyrophosphorylase
MRLGLSTHGYYEMLRALHFRPSYLAFGAVFATGTKTLATAPQGLARLERYVRLLDAHIPLVAIGGIDAARLPAVLATGVGSVALVSAITAAPDTARAIAELQHAFRT